MSVGVEGDELQGSLVTRLSMLDRFLPLWIVLAMAGGLLLGRGVPGLGGALSRISFQGTSIPIALGLLVMMYPVLARVRYGEAAKALSNRKLLVSSLVLNWVIGPALMFTLAWVFLPNSPAYRTGLILVGLARCIAMVLIWNDLACGDGEAGALLVAINALFQVVAYAALGWFYLEELPRWLGLSSHSLKISTGAIALSVLIFLGVPLVAGYLTRRTGEHYRGREWYEGKLLPAIGPFALYGLLFTIVLLFALQGKEISSHPGAVLSIALPLVVYFAVMWGLGMALGKSLGLSYPKAVTLAFTAAGNNFELAIAVAIATFGPLSGEALSGVVGPLIEVPALVGLVYLALALRKRWLLVPG